MKIALIIGEEVAGIADDVRRACDDLLENHHDRQERVAQRECRHWNRLVSSAVAVVYYIGR